MAAADEPGAIAEAAAVLKRGGLVAFPTDTVYGVGALVWDTAAVASIYVAKQRAPEKAIPLLVASKDALVPEHGLVGGQLPPTIDRLAACFWPGALTLVVPCSSRVPAVVTGGGNTVAMRVPDHPVALRLLAVLDAPLAATSANLSGQPSPLTAQEVMAQLAGRIDFVLDGGSCPGGIASTVLDLTCEPPRVLRAGPISATQLEEVLESPVFV